MFQPTENHTDVGLGIAGTVLTGVSEVSNQPPWLTMAVGIATLIYIVLKCVGWFLDRFGKKKPTKDHEQAD
jgi:hypothetical protein